MKKFFSYLLSFMAVILIVTPGFCSQKLLEQILSELEKKYADKSFSAYFSQTSILSALDIQENSSGKIWLSHPGRMKWEYIEPDRQEIIINNKTVWIYRPGQNQVMKGNAAEFLQSGAAWSFLSDISLIHKENDISINKTENGWLELGLIPKKKTFDIKSILIRISKKNNEIIQVTSFDTYGDATQINFSDIRFEPIPLAKFQFIPPKGVDIIDMH